MERVLKLSNIRNATLPFTDFAGRVRRWEGVNE